MFDKRLAPVHFKLGECWYSVWTPPQQLPGNSQVCSSLQLPGNSQVGLTHYKRGCLAPPFSLASLVSLTLLLLLAPHSLPPLNPCGHGQPLFLYSLLLSAFLCLYYSLNSPPPALNKLYSILYSPVTGPSGRRDGLTWAPPRHPLPHTPPARTYLYSSFSFYDHNSRFYVVPTLDTFLRDLRHFLQCHL